MEHRIIWWWDKNTRVSLVNSLTDDPNGRQSDKVHAKQITSYVESFLAQGISTPHVGHS